MNMDEVNEWGRERCGIYEQPGMAVWAGPYHDAYALDRAMECWYSNRILAAFIALTQAADLQEEAA